LGFNFWCRAEIVLVTSPSKVFTCMAKSNAPLIQSAPRRRGPGSLVTPYIENHTVQLFASRYRLKVRTDVDETKIVTGRHGQVYEDDHGKLGVM
jgi:hypothetical protein